MKVFTALMVSMLIVPGVNGQEITFRDTIQKLIDRVSTSLAYPGQVKQFYSLHAARRVWVTNAPAQRLLLQYLDSAAYFGLRPEDYHYDFMLSWRNETSSPADESLLTAEVFFTDAALHFFHDIHMGNEKPPMTYDGLNFVPDWSAIPAQLASALQFGSLHQLLRDLEWKTPAYTAIKEMIAVRCEKSISNPLTAVETRQLASLNSALNTVRWLMAVGRYYPRFVVVNIPSATLLAYDQKAIVLESNVVVGATSRRTPVFCSQIHSVIVYPYWHVPISIATRELLPHIKKNIRYLEANNFQVLNEKGKIVDPATINWQALRVDSFPYTLRQGTGCDNSLGIVKIDFYNPYSVFLHDSPLKSLFTAQKRFYSHGCIRVEKAVPLAQWLLQDQAVRFDSLVQKGMEQQQQPTVMTLAEKVPVLVLYNTAWFDAKGNVAFFDDVYRKFR